MAQSNAARLSLHIARSLAAATAMEKVRDLSLDAQAARDAARILYDQATASANDAFTDAVAMVTREYERQIRSLTVDPDDYGDELDD